MFSIGIFVSMQRARIITRNVWILSLVSLFNDASSEMLTPVMPLYLKSIGFSIVLIGVLEGVAEAVAGLSKGYFGHWSDKISRRLPFVQVGYLLSNIAKTLMVAFANPFWVLFTKAGDKLGKGIRTGARDALLSDEATPETKGRVFGFHRAMDTFGAVIGPLSALLYLYFYPGNYKPLFFIAFVPGLISMAFTLFIKEHTHQQVAVKARPRFLDFINYWKQAPAQYRQVVTGLLMFALVNSSDVFLLLKMKEAGYGDAQVISIYIFYNLIYALASYPMGALADRVGKKTVFILGLIFFVALYTGMAFTHNQYVVYSLFFLYGLYAAATEGIAKAWITNISSKKDTATAIGTFTAFQSIALLIASASAGVLWATLGAPVAFIVTAAVTLLVVVYLFSIKSALHV